MKESKCVSVGLIVLMALLIVTAAIAIPILFRPFYYMQIGPLELEAATGLSRGEIVQAYDEMMNFCIGISDEFSTGSLAWSEWGRAHFVDVRNLFLLDLAVLAVSGLGLLAYALLHKKMNVRAYPLRGRSAGFWAGSSLLTAFAFIGGLAALDFSKAFEVFHTLFFPGKENWIFTPSVDAIITILPEEFFASCGALILGLIIMSCTILIVRDVYKKRAVRATGNR